MYKKFVFAILFLLFLSPSVHASEKILTISTTTSTQASGLLDILLPEFYKDTQIKVKVIAKGTGAAIRDGMEGNVDLIFVHAKQREENFVADGYGTKRYAVMHNDFIITGPDKDPAGIKGMTNASQALKKIALSKSKFISRGDDSGTHTKEQQLWKKSGLKIDITSKKIIKKGKEKEIKFIQPSEMKARYISIGQGMGKTLTFAEEKQAYTLTDRGTYIKYKLGRKTGLDLNILCQGGPDLANPYGVIPINPAKFPHVKQDLAKKFVEWITSKKGQSLIANYKLMGNQLFYPDAILDAK